MLRPGPKGPRREKMRKMLFAALLAATLFTLSSSSFAQVGGCDPGTEIRTDDGKTQIVVDGNVRMGGDVNMGGQIDVNGNVIHSGTVHMIVDNPSTPTAETKTVYRTKKVYVPGSTKTVEQTPIYINNQIPAPAATPIILLTPTETSGTNAGNGKGENGMNPIGIGLLVILGIAVTGGAVAMIIGIINSFAEKIEKNKTEQKHADNSKHAVEKVEGCDDGDMSVLVTPTLTSVKKKLRTVAQGTVPLHSTGDTNQTQVQGVHMTSQDWQAMHAANQIRVNVTPDA